MWQPPILHLLGGIFYSLDWGQFCITTKIEGQFCNIHIQVLSIFFSLSTDFSLRHRPLATDHHTGTLPTSSDDHPSQRFPHHSRASNTQIRTTTLSPTPNTQICVTTPTLAPKHDHRHPRHRRKGRERETPAAGDRRRKSGHFGLCKYFCCKQKVCSFYT
jgi:hypothetical protein